MKTILLSVLVACSTQCFAQIADEGSYVVVRGAVSGCEQWRTRILDAVKIEKDKPINLLGVPAIEVWSLDKKQIKANLLSAIEKSIGSEPETISIEVLESQAEYEAIAKEFILSLNALLDGKCLYWDRDSVNRADVDIEKEMERIKRNDLARSAV